NRLIRCVCGKKIGPDPRNFNQRVSLGRNDLLIRTFLSLCHLDYLWTYCLFYWTRTSARQTHPLFRTGGSVNRLFPTFCHRN
ncbi:hypothetical protein FCY46_14880, partial [Escherichia coli]|nr:hypothetical protein [Escherichia coli]